MKQTHVEPHEFRRFMRLAFFFHIRQLDWFALKTQNNSTVMVISTNCLISHPSWTPGSKGGDFIVIGRVKCRVRDPFSDDM